jgi:hypothetical protein
MPTKLRRVQSVLGGRASCRVRREEPRRKTPLTDGREDGRVRYGVPTTAGTPRGRLPPVTAARLPLLIARADSSIGVRNPWIIFFKPFFLLQVLFRPNGLRRH